MLEMKDYQIRVLETFDRWLVELRSSEEILRSRRKSLLKEGEEITEEDENYPKRAWERLSNKGGMAAKPAKYVNRTDDAGRSIPHVCFKVPTGGGKTLLAASALERLNRQTGLTLWVVPSNAIYDQTKSALWSREHSYRQILERASGGRVKMLEREDPFNRDDVANYLCVMLLMLPAANKSPEKKLKQDTPYYRLFRDSGRYPSFFPENDDILGNRDLLRQFPDLVCGNESGLIIQNLFNVFKLLRPVVVLDEAHKAKRMEENKELADSISRLNPSMVIELSATPNAVISNLLVDIDGRDLKKEEMIKLPVQVTSFPNSEWQTTLLHATEELEKLDTEARTLENNTGRYIRPIAVVRVQSTGKDQKHKGTIHADHVLEYLEHNVHVPKDAIRIKSSVTDELKGEDLLSEFSPVKWIITKDALKEGWDCPFAYLLVILDNTKTKTAITQLVGRVMRQPEAQLTGIQSLDQCYVYCHNAAVGDVVKQVRNGLQAEGLTGLGDEVLGQKGEQLDDVVPIKRREPFQNKEIFLPLVVHSNGGQWIELDYERHILSHIDWMKIQAPKPKISAEETDYSQSIRVDLDDQQFEYGDIRELKIDKSVSLSRFVGHLADIVPNPWHAARISHQLIEREHQRGQSEEQIYDRRKYLTHLLREHVKKEVETQAESIFQEKLNAGQIRFDLETSIPRYRMVCSYEIHVGRDYRPLIRKSYEPVQLNLFEPVFDGQFNKLEMSFARYLDEQTALKWWHRVAARQNGDYYLQGWRPGRIYPDFVALASGSDDEKRVLIFDTKGEHLSGNQDTEYKRKVLETLEGAFNGAGMIKLHEGTTIKGVFELVFEKQLETNFAELTPRLKGEL